MDGGLFHTELFYAGTTSKREQILYSGVMFIENEYFMIGYDVGVRYNKRNIAEEGEPCVQYISDYESPLGRILLAADETGLAGVWFEGQKYFRCV